MKILLLEDEYALRKSVKEFLEDYDYIVDEFSDGQKALDAIYSINYDLILLDVNVPSIKGFDILKEMRNAKISTPTIFITSLTEIDNLERGFEVGCCDYIKKPFDLSELRLRVASALKHSSLKTIDNTISLPYNYTYDTKNFKLKYNGIEVQLSKTEKTIFELFLKNKNQIITTQMISDYVWEDYVDPTNVRVHINNLRKKLDKRLIENIRGLGYKIATES